MVLSKGFALLCALILICGLLVGAFALSQNFALLRQYTAEVDLVYAHFKTLEVNANASASRDETHIAYILILNITNPTNEIVEIWHAEVTGFAIIRIDRSFPREDIDYVWYPNMTKLIAITGVGSVPLSYLGQTAPQQGNFFVTFTLFMWGRTQAGSAVSSNTVQKTVQLSVLSIQEYEYKGFFTDHRFRLRGDGPNVIIETGG